MTPLEDAMDDSALDSKPAMKVSIKAEPLDGKHAASELLKAIEAKDVNAIDDALKLHYAACQSKMDDDGEEDGEDGKGY
jgi:putative IMPACT (imprinted ancient) family translation regulator